MQLWLWGSLRRKDGRMLAPYIGPGEKYDQAVVSRTRDWLSDAADRQQDRGWCLYVGLVAPHFPLIVALDMYPLDIPPPTKARPSEGYVQHPWVAKQNSALLTDKVL